MRLADKIAIVTGAGSGFGARHRQALRGGGRARGRQRRQRRAWRETRRRRSAPPAAAPRFCAGDVSKDADVARARARSRSTRSAASTSSSTTPARRIATSRCSTSAEAEFDRIYAVNVKSLYLTARHAVPHFRAQRDGVFITIASTAGVRPRRASPGTTAARVRRSSRRGRWRPSSRRTTSASTSSTRSPARPRCSPTSWARTRREKRAQFVASIPLGRLSQPSDIATAAVFFASDEAAFITGACLEVDGGRCV